MVLDFENFRSIRNLIMIPMEGRNLDKQNMIQIFDFEIHYL